MPKKGGGGLGQFADLRGGGLGGGVFERGWYPNAHYVLSDQVWWCNIKQFSSYSKNYIWKFMQTNSWHHKLFHFHLSFWIWKVWKGRERITETWISWERKELFDEIKHIFYSFLRALIWWKNKNLIKIVDTSFFQ